MKIDPSKKQNRFTQRTLDAFSNTLMQLLTEKSFEDITVNQLCEKSCYPRSTFYNYFEDIFDLMNYCWEKIDEKIQIDDYEAIPHEDRTVVLFERLYFYMESEQRELHQILVHNTLDGKMVMTLNQFIRRKIHQIMMRCPETEKLPVPFELLVEQYSSTIQLILEWCFFRKEKTTREEALTYLTFFIGTLEKEKKRI